MDFNGISLEFVSLNGFHKEPLLKLYSLVFVLGSFSSLFSSLRSSLLLFTSQWFHSVPQ